MTPFDYAVLAVVGVSVLVSLFRGAVREVMSILSWIAAFLIALHYAPMLSELLPAAVKHSWLRLFVAFVVLMISSLLLFALFTLRARKLSAAPGLTPGSHARRLLRLVRAASFVLLVLLGGLTPLPREPAWRNAMFRPPLEAIALYARGYLPQRFTEHIRFDKRAPPA